MIMIKSPTVIVSTEWIYIFMNNLSENQAGFKPEYSTLDHLFTIKKLIDVFL